MKIDCKRKIKDMSDIEEEELDNRTVKITVVGQPSVGKSSLCVRYLGGDTSATAGGTLGAEVMAGHCLGLRPPVPIQLCDVAGNALSTNMLGNYLYDSDIILLVYDLTNLQSFDKLTTWISAIKEIFENESKKPLLGLFGNKSDLEHQRAVRLSCVQKLASEHLLENFKGSARTGEMVNIAFTSLVSRALGPRARAAPPLSDKSPVASSLNGHALLPLTTQPSQSLIMNRKALRKVKRKASSSVCILQ